MSRETDIALRSHLAERGGKKGDLSKFIERAVQKEMLRAMMLDIERRKYGLRDGEAEALIDGAWSAIRAEFWRDRNW